MEDVERDEQRAECRDEEEAGATYFGPTYYGPTYYGPPLL